MAVADPPKEDSAVKNMKSRSLLLSSNEMTHYFKEQRTTVPRKKIKAISTPKQQLFQRKQLFRNSPLQVQMSRIALLKKMLYLMNNCNCCCEIVKLIYSPYKNGMAASVFVHLTQNFPNKNHCNQFCDVNRYL